MTILRVLTVDDSRTILAMLHHTLSNAGFEVLQAEGKTVILVSHSTAIVQDMCDQAAWVNKGELMQVGDAKPTIQAYLDSVPHDAS